MRKLFKSNKFKKILTISLVTLLAIGTLGVSLAFFGRDDFNWVKNKVENAFVQDVTKESNNLLKNSNFAINSSEVAVFDETNVTLNNPLVDNWNYFTNDTSTVSFTAYQVEEGLYVKNSGNTTFHLSQILNEDKEMYIDRDVTLSLSLNGVVYSVSKYFTESSSVTLGVTSNFGSTVKIIVEKGKCSVSMYFNAGFEGVINWVQFEEGAVFTGYVEPIIAE